MMKGRTVLNVFFFFFWLTSVILCCIIYFRICLLTAVEAITDPNKLLAVRVHDECNGSDVFGSDICTCRPYLAHAIEVAIQVRIEYIHTL
jgi:hypothetical protein